MIYLFNLLDPRLETGRKAPPFLLSYLEHRVRNEPESGNPSLTCIRRIATTLAQDEEGTSRYVRALCVLAAPKFRLIFRDSFNERRLQPWSREKFDAHVHAAAVHLGCVADVERMGAPMSRADLFGDCLHLAATSGSTEMLGLYFQNDYHKYRCRALVSAAEHGETYMVRFVLDYDAGTSCPWTFDPHTAFRAQDQDEPQALKDALKTPNPEIWDIIMDLLCRHRVPVGAHRHALHLVRCAEEGWPAMMRHLFARGFTPNYTVVHGNVPYGLGTIPRAAGRGYTDVVQVLLDWGAKDVDNALSEAVNFGSLDIVKLLLSHHANPTWLAKHAARRGRGDIVKVLLQHGGTTQKDDERHVSAVGFAILTEHTALFDYLRDHGAALPTGASRKACIQEARRRGVEHMLALLGLDTSNLDSQCDWIL